MPKVTIQAIKEQELGPGHQDTATSVNNLGLLYYSQGKYEEAEPLLERALGIWEESLGAQHPWTQAGRRNYAVLRAMGREEEAEQEEGSPGE
jgi:tetratricopeptide (TPR) repeat protein